MTRSLSLARIALLFAPMIVLGAVPALAEQKMVDLTIREGTLPPEQRVIRVQQGDTVVLRWTSDRGLMLHLHGYDIEQRVTPGMTATMRFTARATGRFSIEIHGGEGHRATTLAYLEVHPQ